MVLAWQFRCTTINSRSKVASLPFTKGCRKNMDKTPRRIRSALITLVLFSGASACAQTSPFVSFEQAQPALNAYHGNLPAGLSGLSTAAIEQKWNAWVRGREKEVRSRLQQGEEDTITNFLRYGVTYTKQPRLDWPLLYQYGHDPAATALAEKRADDLVRGLATPGSNDHLIVARAFVLKQGYSPDSANGRAALKKYLLANLARMQKEYLGYLEEKKQLESGPHDEAKWLELNSHLYANRGISLDTDIRPNYAIDVALKVLSSKALISADSIRRVAIIGPGLDFVNKEDGTDLYPPQTVQPFAVIDSLQRLKLADPHQLRVVTYDISSNVNQHLNNAIRKANQGVPYRIQLPIDSAIQPTAEFRSYWEDFGARIGKPTTAIDVPQAASNVKLRAISIRPEVVKTITPLDMNVVFQYAALPATQRFNLIIGTNIFVYYDAFEQALTRENLARMLAPDGILISNTLLSSVPGSSLTEIARVKAVLTESKASELLFIYRRAR